jgi:hypothetical protein
MLAAADGGRPERVGEQRKDGFETSLTVAGQPASLTVQALDGEGRVIGSCEPRERRG